MPPEPYLKALQQVDYIYGRSDQGSGVVGVAKDSTQFVCFPGSLVQQGLKITWTAPPCGAATPTPSTTLTPTATATDTATPSATESLTPERTPTGCLQNGCTPTPARTASPTTCPMNFSDVQPSDYFYEAVQYLYCGGVISGYGDSTFRPYNNTTRGQMCKIIVLARQWPIYTPPTPTFRDVPTGHPFYEYIETAFSHSIVSGYSCGEECLEFRPENNVTRGQLCKIVVLAMNWPLIDPSSQTFIDVSRNYAFYTYIATAVCHQIVSGYSDHTFRPGNNATRGQLSAITYLALLNQVSCTIPPECEGIPASVNMLVLPRNCEQPSSLFEFVGWSFQPTETVAVYLFRPNGSLFTHFDAEADSNGMLSESLDAWNFEPGIWTTRYEGYISHNSAIGYFRCLPDNP